MKKKDEKECGRQCWAPAQDHEARSVERRGAQILEKEEEDARLPDRCEARGKNGQSIGNVT